MEQTGNNLSVKRIKQSPDAEGIFRSLGGVWRFTRQIKGCGKMSGTATFIQKSPNLLLYREDGLLKLNDGPVFESYRNYIYELKNDKITALFEDGRFFHELEFDGGVVARGHHECGLDLYRASYHFETPNAFSLQWAVTGPKKDYTILTNFEKRITC